jgi:hypothetical protein
LFDTAVLATSIIESIMLKTRQDFCGDSNFMPS